MLWVKIGAKHSKPFKTKYIQVDEALKDVDRSAYITIVDEDYPEEYKMDLKPPFVIERKTIEMEKQTIKKPIETEKMSESEKAKSEEEFKSALARIEGKWEIDKNNNSIYFYTKDRDGYPVTIDFGRFDDFVSVGAQYNCEAKGYLGQGCPHKSAEAVKEDIESIIVKYNLITNNKKAEQLTLF